MVMVRLSRPVFHGRLSGCGTRKECLIFMEMKAFWRVDSGQVVPISAIAAISDPFFGFPCRDRDRISSLRP
jgi:hypothetical protein